jgi:hypothetical protein
MEYDDEAVSSIDVVMDLNPRLFTQFEQMDLDRRDIGYSSGTHMNPLESRTSESVDCPDCIRDQYQFGELEVSGYNC